MAGILKRWLKAFVGMRVVLALLYLLTTFGLPLNHTCQLAAKDIHHRYLELTNQRHCGNNFVERKPESGQYDCDKADQPYGTYCCACLYSITSKTFKLRSNVPLLSAEVVAETQKLPKPNPLKQVEWLCSISLRAPPITTS